MPIAAKHMVLAAVAAGAWTTAAAADPKVIELTQVGCQFLEAENGVDRHYQPKSEQDCEAINARTGSDRVAEAKVLELPPGDYVFRVSNRNVPYEVGFWLRSSDYDWRNPLHQVSKTNVSGGGLTTGVTKDYPVTLKPGEYTYSCPLNPTPDYKLLVKG